MTTPNNLPAELTSFVGRERQLAELRRMLRRSRLVTLTGPGGAGKTRLALRLAAKVLDTYPGDALFVAASAVSDPATLERTVATACGVREVRKRPALEAVIEKLRSTRTLLLFDGCERLVDACAAIADRLLRACPELTILVTSREPLGVRGEIIWRTPSLTVPDPERVDRLEVLLKSESVRLFEDRAQLALPGFRVGREAVSDLAAIAQRLEGLPLAIELAASLVDTMTLDEIRTRLSDRFRLLTGRSRGGLARYQTLREAIDWSYNLLDAEEKHLLIRLASFTGGFDADAAIAITATANDETADTIAILRRLVNKSLVIAEGGTVRMRYRLLDTIREYAMEELSERPDALDVWRDHAMYYVAFGKEAAANLRRSDQGDWMQRIQDDEPNIRAALEWCQAQAPDSFLHLAAHMSRYWYVRGKFVEGLDWLDRALAIREGGDDARIGALQARARLRRHHGDYAGARADAEECAALARKLGRARDLLGALTTLGILSSSLDEWDSAESYYREGLAITEELGDAGLIAGALNNLALTDSARGDHETATKRAERALELARVADDRILTGLIVETSGRVARRRGDNEMAREMYREALNLSSTFEDVLNIADVLDGMALLALAEKDAVAAMVLFGATDRHRAVSGAERVPFEKREIERGIKVARAALPRRAYEAAWNKGWSLSLKDAIAFAMGSPVAPSSREAPALTTREMEVAELIADGLTNAEIARRLRFAERTADAHVEHIRNKLGMRTRSQIAVWAHEQAAKPAR